MIIFYSICNSQQTSNLLAFSNDAKVRDFIGKFLTNEESANDQTIDELEMVQILSLQFYHCLTKDTMHAFRIFIDLLMVIFGIFSKLFSIFPKIDFSN